MSEINIYKTGNVLGATMFDSYKNQYKTFYDDEVLNVLNVLKKHKDEIKNIFFSGNDLNFNLKGVKISLSDKNNLKKDKRFDFIFKYIEDKKYRLRKARFQKLSVSSLAMLISIIGIVSVKAADGVSFANQDYTMPETTYMDDSELTLSSVNNAVSSNDDLNEIYQTEDEEDVVDASITHEESESEVSYDELASSSIIENLNIGSMSYSEKLEYVKENYGDIIEKYANTYGLDADLIAAIATQERGKHSTSVDSGGAIGLMQIQVDVWDGHSVTAYNYDTESNETVKITLNQLKNVDFNIKTGCMIYQSYLKQMENNVIAALQSYNMGPSSVKKIIETYASENGKTYDEVINDYSDIAWLDYRNSSYAGDENYVENVLRYYSSDTKKVGSIN